MVRFSVSGLSTAIVLVFVSPSYAGETKVGYVDMQKAVQSTEAGKKAKSELEAEFAKRKKDLDKDKDQIEKKGQELEKKKSVLSEEVLHKKELEIQDEMIKFQKRVADNQQEIKKMQDKLMPPILEKMHKVIEKIANEKGYSMVLEKTEQNVLYAKKEIDLTEDVVKAFEAQKN